MGIELLSYQAVMSKSIPSVTIPSLQPQGKFLKFFKSQPPRQMFRYIPSPWAALIPFS